MEKTLKIGRVSATGGVQLFVGIILSNVILAIGTIILARLLLPEEYGLYTVVLIPLAMINLFRDWGVNSALTKYVAHFRATEGEEDLRDTIAAGMIFEISTGLALTLLAIFLANFIASVFNRPQISPLISIISVAIFSGSLFTAAQSIFVGFERMELNSLALICQAVAKTLISPMLVILGFGVLGAVLGYALSHLVAGIAGLLVLYLIFLRKINKKRVSRFQVFRKLKNMLHYGVPLSISSILEGVRLQFYSFMMALFCTNEMIGNYQAAINFAVLIFFITFPITTVLFPAFAKLNPTKDAGILKAVFSSSVKYTALLSVPATLAVTVLSRPMINTLFGERWLYAPLFLSLYVLGNLFSGIGSLSVDGLLRGLGETKTLMKLSLLTLLVSLPLAVFLIPTLGIIGLILGHLFASIPSIFLGIHWVWKRYQVAVDWKSSAKIFAASSVATAITYFSLTLLNQAEFIRLIIGGAVFLSVFMILAPSIGAISQDDISNLRAMLSGLGFVSTMARFPLALVEKVAAGSEFLRKNRSRQP